MLFAINSCVNDASSEFLMSNRFFSEKPNSGLIHQKCLQKNLEIGDHNGKGASFPRGVVIHTYNSYFEWLNFHQWQIEIFCDAVCLDVCHINNGQSNIEFGHLFFKPLFFWIGIWLKLKQLKPRTTLTIYFEGIVHFHFPRRSLAKHGVHLQEFAKVEIPRIVGGKSLANSFSKWVLLKKLPVLSCFIWTKYHTAESYLCIV